MRLIRTLIPAALTAGLIIGLAGLPAAAAVAATTAAVSSASAGNDADNPDAYILGPGDQLKLFVYGEADISGQTYLIDGLGFVSLPLIGQVHVGGMTKGQVEQAVTEKYHAGYLNDPKVNIEIVAFRPFYILGEVQKPGEYPFTHGLTVMAAVATAEGFTYRANKHKVYVKHEGQKLEQALPLTSATPVMPGDTIRIGERFF
jgi:polysaccharide export outer membrane protein